MEIRQSEDVSDGCGWMTSYIVEQLVTPQQEPDVSTDERLDEDLSGLQWLSRHRPEAMEHLLAFFKESGRHLDPKTRFLISIVTKVINFTPRGLRQYIPRAMREGASRDEVLDAILCTYPAAGLTKVVDAVDILRSIPDVGDSPSVSTGDSAVSSSWQDAGPVEDIPEGRGQVVVVDGRRLVLFRLGDQVHAVINSCIHQGGELGGGTLTDTVVTCPLHGWQFDITDGSCLTVPGASIDTFDTRIKQDRVEVLL